MSDLPKHEKRPRRKSSLARELQDLIDREERFKDNYGDFENSWTSTCVSPLQRAYHLCYLSVSHC